MKFIIVTFICLCAIPLGSLPSRQGVVIWNVGQGQWLSFVEQDRCYHFDAGGEFFPWKHIKSICGWRQNLLSLSHWDWDHIGALSQRSFHRSLPHTCLWHRPPGASSPRKERLLTRIPDCPEIKVALFQWVPQQARTANDASQVFQYRQVLIPGDSSSTQERIWVQSLLKAPPARVLVLGHHGSKTSTSEHLLQNQSGIKMAVSSARWKRYFHPHPQTQVRLKKFHIPLIRTEDWGHLWLE